MSDNKETETAIEGQAQAQLMHLQVLLPFKVLATYDKVQSIILETPKGAYGLLPHRQDCVAALEPGILSYTILDKPTQYLAVDEGILVKNGQQVRVSVRNAHKGTDLAQLKRAVQKEILSLSEEERETREVLARLESGFMRGFKSLNTL